MPAPNDTPTSPAGTPPLDLETLLGALCQIVRWKMLRELSVGEPREINELATVAGCSYDSAIKHIAVLREAGLVERGRGGVIQIPKRFLSNPDERVLDFGHCLLRMDVVKQP